MSRVSKNGDAVRDTAASCCGGSGLRSAGLAPRQPPESPAGVPAPPPAVPVAVLHLLWRAGTSTQALGLLSFMWANRGLTRCLTVQRVLFPQGSIKTRIRRAAGGGGLR